MRRRADSASVSNEELTAASTRLVQALLAMDDADPGLIAESIDQLWIVPVEGGPGRAMTVLDDYLTKSPGELEMVLERGNRRYMLNDLAGAEADALAVANSEPLTAGFLSQLQFEMRKGASSLLCDIAYRHLESADPADKAARMVDVQAARERLATHVVDQANDPLMLRIDGKMAFAKGDYPRATALFERLMREPAGQSVETLLFATFCLENVGEVGLAYERLVTLMQNVPPSPQLTMRKARLEVRMGRFPEATDTIASLSESDRQTPEVKDIVRLIQSRSAGAAEKSEDPVTRAIGQANTALEQGDVDTARSTLTASLVSQPDNLPIIVALTQLETRVGQTDAAREYLAKAKAIQPDHQMVKQLDAVLQYSDPQEALVHYCEVTIPDEADRAVAIASQLDVMATRQKALADALESQAKATTDPAEKARLSEASVKATELFDRAAKEQPVWLAKARSLGADNPQLAEFEFRKALSSKDWTTAESVVARAKASNLDQVNGSLYQAQLTMSKAVDDLSQGRADQARANFRESVRTLESVTDRLPFSSPAWHLLGTAYQAMGNYGQAQRAYERAYSSNPLNSLVAHKYADSLIKTGDRVNALRILRAAYSLNPTDIWFRENWLDLEASDGDKLRAFRERRRIYKESQSAEVLKKDFGARANAAALARLLGETEPSRTTIMDRNGELSFSEQRWVHLSNEEKADAIKKTRAAWQAEADQIITKLAEGAEGDLQFAILRAHLLRVRNDVLAGENVLRDYLARQKDEPNAEMSIALARYLSDSNHFVEAIAVLNEAVEYQDPKLREANLALGNLYMQVN
jgi:tetratricopeptide (TPR) repeat protein